MKRHSLRYIMPRLAIALALAVALLALTTGSIINLLAGAKPLDASSQVGDYVSVDKSQLISIYAALSSGSKTTDNYYILHLGDGVYLSMHAPASDEETFQRATSQAYDYYRNNSNILNPMGMISGQLTTPNKETSAMLIDWASQSSLPGFEDADAPTGKVLPLELQYNRIGLLSITWNWILFGLGIACLIWFGVELYLIQSGKYFRHVRQALGNSAAANQDWQKAEPFGNARIGKDYIWYTRGPQTEVCSLPSVIWVYKQFDSRVTGRYKWPVSVFTRDQSYHELCVREDAQREQLIAILHAHGGKFVTGYSQDNYNQFCNDFDAFCARAAANDPNANAPVIKLPD